MPNSDFFIANVSSVFHETLGVRLYGCGMITFLFLAFQPPTKLLINLFFVWLVSLPCYPCGRTGAPMSSAAARASAGASAAKDEQSSKLQQEVAPYLEVLSSGATPPDDKVQVAIRLCMMLKPSRVSSEVQTLVRPAIPTLVSMIRDSSKSSGQKVAATALGRACRLHDANQRETLRCGGVDVLVIQMRQGVSTVKERSAQALWSLSDLPDTHQQIADCGGLSALVHLLQSGNPAARLNAAGALIECARSDRCRRAIGERGGIRPLVSLLRLGGDRAKTNAALALAELSKGCAANEAEMRAAGVVELLLSLVQSQYGGVVQGCDRCSPQTVEAAKCALLTLGQPFPTDAELAFQARAARRRRAGSDLHDALNSPDAAARPSRAVDDADSPAPIATK